MFSPPDTDTGNTNLIKMDIDTGDSHPISQKPYILLMKHETWVQQELDILEKAGVITRSVLHGQALLYQHELHEVNLQGEGHV